MKIFVKAKPCFREERIEKTDENHYIVCVKEKAEKGEANFAIAKALSVYFKVPFSAIRIISGVTSRQKIIEILGKN